MTPKKCDHKMDLGMILTLRRRAWYLAVADEVETMMAVYLGRGGSLRQVSRHRSLLIIADSVRSGLHVNTAISRSQYRRNIDRRVSGSSLLQTEKVPSPPPSGASLVPEDILIHSPWTAKFVYMGTIARQHTNRRAVLEGVSLRPDYETDCLQFRFERSITYR